MPTGPKGNEGDWKIAHTQKETQCSQKLKKKKAFIAQCWNGKIMQNLKVAWGQLHGDLIALKR